MPRGRFSVLRSQTRKMVFEVLAFMKKEAEEGLQFNLSMVQKRASAATGVSISTIKRILAATKDPNMVSTVFRTPGKKRRGHKRITGLDSFDLGYIKRCVHTFHKTENELPTVQLLLTKLQQDINFKGSMSSLRTILKELGFTWKKTENRKLLIENTNIRLKRIEYLRAISEYRELGRPIIYTDESYYLDSSHEHPRTGAGGAAEKVRKTVSKGQRIAIVLAASETGFVPNAQLLFKASTKTNEYIVQNTVNTENYEYWIRKKLIPNLRANSVVVIGNASYHNRIDDAAPTACAKKSVMETWLREKNIPFDSSMLKPELYKLICSNKEKHKKYFIENLLRLHSHTVLRLPPCHPDLNPIKMAWAPIRGYVAQKNIKWHIDQVMKLISEKVNKMGELEWRALCARVRMIEEEYKKNEVIIDAMTEEFPIYGEDRGSDESESDSETEDEIDMETSSSDEEDSI